MDIIAFLLDFILHVDVHLATFVQAYGAWVYALLFAIIFVETGVVVMPFLPGDSLLFVVGAMSGAGLMSLPLTLAAMQFTYIVDFMVMMPLGPQFTRLFGISDAQFGLLVSTYTLA
ncbi:MAG TPA: hypothetical protein VE029_04375, partial [Rhizobacter sp.]|nr:hypothetical protein [Rhizobacter sp.]